MNVNKLKTPEGIFITPDKKVFASGSLTPEKLVAASHLMDLIHGKTRMPRKQKKRMKQGLPKKGVVIDTEINELPF